MRLSMDDQVNLPRLYINWHSPASFTAGEANLDLLSRIMGQGKSSRLYKRLVYDLKLAQNVSVSNPAQEIAGKFTIVVTAAPGKTLDEIEPLVWEEVEKVRASAPTDEEVERARISLLAGRLRGLSASAASAAKAICWPFMKPSWAIRIFWRKISRDITRSRLRRSTRRRVAG